VPARLLHLSDLHVGTVEEPDVERALGSLIERVDPELIVASGDLTHRARPREHDRAAAFLKRLERPLLVVPGNHDIPWAFPARFTHPFREFERHWQTTEPVHQGDGLFVVGLNSVRPGGTSRAVFAPGSCNGPPSCSPMRPAARFGSSSSTTT
jgi:3',5'-cyclic AMP phosphodiesterase CpdA